MKRWLSAMLSLTMLLSSVPGDVFRAYAEQTEAVSANVDAEVPLSGDAGDSGLIVEIDEFEWTEDPLPGEEADSTEAEDAESDLSDEETTVDTSEEFEGAAGEDSSEDEAQETQRVPASEDASFVFGYAQVIAEKAKVYRDAEGEYACAMAGLGEVMLCTGRNGGFMSVAFAAGSDIFEGFMKAEDLMAMTGDEIGAFMDAAAESGSVLLYNDDIDLPLPAPACEFEQSGTEEIPAETPGQDAVLSQMTLGEAGLTLQNTSAEEEETAFVLSPEKAALAVGESFTLEVTDKNGSAVNAVFTTGNGEIATVSETGIVTAQAAGECEITADVNGKILSCRVSVHAAPSGMRVSEYFELFVGQTRQIEVTFEPENTASILNFESSHPDIASVDASGVITAKGEGTATISVKSRSGCTDECIVTVITAPEDIKLEAPEMDLSVKMQAKIAASMVDGDGEEMDVGFIYTYVPEDPEKPIVAVDENTGVVVAKNTGTAKVVVTAKNGFGVITGDDGNPVSAVCLIRVAAAPAKVKLAAAKGSVGYKEYFAGLNPKAYAADGEEVPASFTYKSSNKKYVTVSEDGEIYGKKAGGSAYVYAYAHNGKYARCKVTVKKAPSKVTLNPADITLSAGGMVFDGLKASVNSAAACNSYTYSGYDRNIISVSASGVITSKNAGNTEVTVSAYNGASAVLSVSVKNPPAEVFFLQDDLTIGVGQTALLKAENRNSAGESAPSGYTYSVADKDRTILEVDPATGSIRGLTPGSATVYVTTHNGVTTWNDDGETRTAACRVTVLEAPSKIAFAVSKINIGYKEKYQGLADAVRYVMADGETLITPEDAAEQKLFAASYTFRSSKKSYVSVDAKTGEITGQKAGKSAYIYVTDHNGNYARVKVTVKSAPKKVTVSPSTVKLGANGMKYRLTAKVNSGAYSSGFTYSTSDAAVATVNETTGVITAVNPGEATITARSYNGKTGTCKVIVSPEPAEIFLSDTSAKLGVGSSMPLTASAKDANGETTYADYSYSVKQSGNVIAVDSATGKITALEKGEAVVTVKAHNGITGCVSDSGSWTEAECVVRVLAAPKALTTLGESITIGYKETYKGIPDMIGMTLPEGETECLTGLTYGSTRKTYVTVDAETGEIYGKKTGYSYITVTPDADIDPVKIKVTVKKTPTKAILSDTAVTLSAGGQEWQLNATVNSGAACSTYKWESSDTSVAVVSETGRVTSVGPGTADITVTPYKGSKATCRVTVLEKPVQVFLPETITVAKGQKARIEAHVCGYDGAQSTADYTYSADDARIALDPATGVITGLELTGNEPAKITVRTHSGLTTHWDENGAAVETQCLVNVIEAPARIELNMESVTIGVSETVALVPVMRDQNGDEMNGGSFIYTVDGASVTVSEEGVIKGKKTGTSYVYVSTPDGTVSEACKVVVKKAPTSVSLTPSSGTLGVGQKNIFKVKLSSGSAGSYTFSSSNKNVAVVEPDGTVTAVGVGKTTITVKTYNGKKDTAKLTVKEGPEFLDLNTEYIELFDEITGTYKLIYFKHMLPGETFKLTYKQEAYTMGNAIDFVSQDESIVSAKPDGTLTAVNEGCTIVMVESSSGVLEMCFVVVESTATPFDFLDEDGEITLAVGDMIPMPPVTNGSELYDMFIEYTFAGKCAEVVQDEYGVYWLHAVKSGTGTLNAESYTGKNAELSVTVAAAPSKVKVDMPDILLVGDSATVNVTYEGLGSYTLSVSDEDLARVSSDGTITALAAGEVTVTATMQTGITAEAKMLLRMKPDRVELAEDSAVLTIGSVLQIEPVIDVNAYTEYTFVSSDANVAEVSETGMVTAKQAGSARITVRTAVPGVFACCDITVIEPAEAPALTVEPGELMLKAGGEGGVFTVSLPEGDSIASVVSDNEAVSGAITFEGNVITIGSIAGSCSARIAVNTANGLAAECAVTVYDAPEAVIADVDTVTLAEGETVEVGIGFTPATAWGSVTTSSENASVASADANGRITAFTAGETAISFSSDGAQAAHVAVKVLHAPEYILLDSESIDITEGASIRLETPKLISTKGPSGGAYAWAIEDESVAIVDDQGNLTAIAAENGLTNPVTTTLMVRAYNGVFTCVPVTVWPAATEIRFAKDHILLAVDQMYMPEVISEEGAAINAVLSSDHPEIVSVEANGGLKGVSEGTAVITAACGELTATIEVTVCRAAESITLNCTGLRLGCGERFVLIPEVDAETAGEGIEMVSDAPHIASVSPDGVVTAHRPGTAVITATAFGGAQASCEVTVMAAPTGIGFEQNGVIGNILEQGVQLEWHFDSEEQGGSIRFESEDESVAEVDENGYVTFKKVGWTTIGVVTYNGYTDTVDVSVQRVPEKIAFAMPEIVLQKGDAVMNPVEMTRGSYANYEIASDDPNVVFADETGLFTAVNPGRTIVNLTTNCGLEASCAVTVVDKLEGMMISSESLSLAKGERAQLSVSFADENAVANVRYVSSNTSIATVDESTGLVTALKKGTCTIYVQTLDGANSDSCKVTVNGPRYRMFMAYEYFGTEFKSNLYFPQNNVNSMKAAFSNSKIDGVQYDIHTMKNPSKNSLLSGLASYFADSNDSDVNVIYLCSHGHANINGTSVNGYTQYGLSLQGYKTGYDLGSPYYYITATELYACLSQIKGKVVLVLDSCHSGQFILNMTPRLKQEKDNRIAVLTAVQGGTNASYYDVSSTTKAVDFFTYFLLHGIGYDEKKDKHDHVLRADANDNGKITLQEFFSYGKTATSGYVSKSSVYKASWFHGNKNQVPQSFIKGDMANLVVYDPK